jgi:hypothetical protein
VFIGGVQFHDGRTERSITIDARSDYDPVTARLLAAALIEAADEVDAL